MRKAQDVHDELRARLHEAAEAHEPDRARILARVERGMSGATERRPRRAARPPMLGWARVVGATAAVAGVLAVGGYAVASAVKEDQRPQQTVTVPPTPLDSPDATSRAPVQPQPTRPTGGSKSPSGKPSSSPSNTPNAPSSAPAAPPQAPASGHQDGSLWSDGSIDPHSNDFWAQSNVTLRNTEQVTSLTVELKIKQTGGVSDTGAWRSAPESDFTTTVVERDGFLVYTWVLKDGRTLAAGEWVFAGQYDHTRGGRDAKDDSYSANARTADEQPSVAGNFATDTSDDGDS
ncbi:hypothetical protein [Streptomyces sp. SD15]